ncbi:hypothetical protein [Hymenobacter mucosus]|uniref:Uncharacterized protein n=1 Tax=Hymenobacter mucosus TaxID=1411120 RepID=A0A239ASL4_9BACT|nr:hypothetical protein [Hymenobacter mucosus]SNR98696.1 hypothetical protein SAMN06269173_11524 [Hymenobacter mucosus]
MAKSPFVKAKIEGPRKRIPVDETLRAEARAGMGGEQTRLEAEGKVAAPATAAPAEAAVPPVPAAPEPTPAPVPVATQQPAPEPGPVVEQPVAAAPTAPYVPTAPVERRPRGRKPAAVGTEPTGELKGVRIAESVWSEIRKIIVQLPKGPDMPTNIIGYLHAAHRHYEAHLRKQGKLPGVN